MGDKQHLKCYPSRVKDWGGVKIDKVKENKHKNQKEAVLIIA
jgi:hypothetical protein